MEIKVDSINITIGKKEISLSVEEAKKLHAALDELFKTRIEYRDYWRWNIPYFIYGSSSNVTYTGCYRPAGGVSTRTL